MPPPILIVEDSRFVRSTLMRLLASHGIAAVEASTAQEALFVLTDHSLFAIIADYHLGGPMTGVDLLQEIRRRQPDAIRVLMSAAAPASVSAALASGDVQHLLHKPFSAAELLATLGR